MGKDTYFSKNIMGRKEFSKFDGMNIYFYFEIFLIFRGIYIVVVGRSGWQ
jgi:hypothetical protein